MLSVLSKVLLCTPPTAAAIWAVAVYWEAYPIKTSSIRINRNYSQAFSESTSITRLVNPRNTASTGDSHEMAFKAPKDLPDEQVLAWFLKGFYASYVFAPESLLLRWLAWEGPQLPGLDKVPPTRQIWNISEIAADALPPAHSILFGTWRIVDIRLPDQKQGNTPSHASSESSVDLAFRPYETFAGCNRFSVSRVGLSGNNDEVRLRYDCIVCDPTCERQPFHSGLLRRFHLIYAQYLYRSGMRAVQHRLRHLEAR